MVSFCSELDGISISRIARHIGQYHSYSTWLTLLLGAASEIYGLVSYHIGEGLALLGRYDIILIAALKMYNKRTRFSQTSIELGAAEVDP